MINMKNGLVHSLIAALLAAIAMRQKCAKISRCPPGSEWVFNRVSVARTQFVRKLLGRTANS